MKSDDMVHKANQIALFFEAYPREQAIDSIADHLNKFWERRMRTQIVAYLAGGGGGLHELAAEAVKRIGPPKG